MGTIKSLLQRFAFLSLIVATFALMLIGKADTVVVERARIAVTDAGGIEALAVIVDAHLAVDDFVFAVTIDIGDSEVVVALASELFIAGRVGIEGPALD